MVEAEINKPTFGQGEGFKDLVHSLSLLSIISLGALIFGAFPKAFLCAHTNLDDGPAERCWNRNWDMQGMFSPPELPHCLTLGFSYPAVIAKTMHLQIELMAINLLHSTKILDDTRYAKNSFFLPPKKFNHMKAEEKN